MEKLEISLHPHKCVVYKGMGLNPQLTLKQRKVLDFIQGKVRSKSTPTIREIAAGMGFLSTGTVRDYLSALENKGYLKRSSNKSRGIELLQDNSGKIPIIANIFAGKPDLAFEDALGYVEVNNLIPDAGSLGDVFALKVKGESMKDAGIMDGDIAIIRKQESADNLDIIAALLDNGEVTLKTFRKKGGSLFLEPANKEFKPIHKEFSVIGKLIAVIRKY